MSDNLELYRENPSIFQKYIALTNKKQILINKVYNKIIDNNISKKIYYEEYMKLYLKDNESIDNFKQLYSEYLDTYNSKKAELSNLNKEIKIIKKLHV